jgi:site-specific recombinase XerD
MLVPYQNRMLDTTPINVAGLPWERAIVGWLETLDSPRTARNYRASVRKFFMTTGSPAIVEAITGDLLVAWRGSLAARIEPGHPSGEHFAPATVNRHIAAMRSFIGYWRARGRCNLSRDEVEATLKVVKAGTRRPYVVLASREMEAILRTAADPTPIATGRERIGRKQQWTPRYKGADSLLAQRDGAIVALALGSGLRCFELAALDIGDLVQRAHIDDQPGHEEQEFFVWWINVRQGKGRKPRSVPVDDALAEQVLHYIAATGRSHSRASDQAAPLWLTRRCGRVSTDHLRALINNAADRATASGDIAATKSISPHSLRHTFAVQQLRHGASVEDLRKLMGHANLSQTQRYADHEDDAHLAKLALHIRRG